MIIKLGRFNIGIARTTLLRSQWISVISSTDNHVQFFNDTNVLLCKICRHSDDRDDITKMLFEVVSHDFSNEIKFEKYLTGTPYFRSEHSVLYQVDLFYHCDTKDDAIILKLKL